GDRRQPGRGAAGTAGGATGGRPRRREIVADGRCRALCVLRARQAGLLRDPDRRAPLLWLLRLPQGRRSPGRELTACPVPSSSSACSSPTPPIVPTASLRWARPFSGWASSSALGERDRTRRWRPQNLVSRLISSPGSASIPSPTWPTTP